MTDPTGQIFPGAFKAMENKTIVQLGRVSKGWADKTGFL
jgi:hypothetical protein